MFEWKSQVLYTKTRYALFACSQTSIKAGIQIFDSDAFTDKGKFYIMPVWRGQKDELMVNALDWD